MANTDSTQLDSDRERDRDRDRDGRDPDRPSSKQKSSSSASKTKDLSHVPCKFFKVGACTAGSSCPFSHSTTEPGGQKETCAWFVKGNCKFGHKCALAHILPGQSMAMDRKNKKAAQAAVAATGGGSERGAREPKGRGVKREAVGQPSGGAGARNPLLAGGSTAPTRILHGGVPGSSSAGRPPMTMPLKATISPSAPAPPLKDTDFASFAALDEMEGVKLSSAPAQGKSSGQEGPSEANQDADASATDDSIPTPQTNPKSSAFVTLPAHPSRMSSNTNTNDFGPIGSPPNYRSQMGQQTSPARLNGNGAAFSPGTSPRGPSYINGVKASPTGNSNLGLLSSSPFSAPGSQSMFLSSSYTTGGGLGGMAASLGSGLMMSKGWGDIVETATPLSASVQRPHGRGSKGIFNEYEDYPGHGNLRHHADEVALEDEDLEDLIPGSLTDLLTPEERSRRLSRSNSGQGPVPVGALRSPPPAEGEVGDTVTAAGGGGQGIGHRYSRSVPAPSLLGDIKSIWADTSALPTPASPPAQAPHRGTSSTSISSRFDSINTVGGIQGTDEVSVSMGSVGAPSSFNMSPSNASAAFLPGLHQHYLNAKAQRAQSQQQAQLGLGGGMARGVRGSSNPLFGSSNGTGTLNNPIASNYLQQPLGGLGLPSSTSGTSGIHTHIHGNQKTTYRTPTSPFDLTQTLHQQQHPHTARPIPSTNDKVGGDDPLLASHLVSPNTRALQAHAPGQSLPQGLAAGYSRIHALPPTNIISPGVSGSFTSGTSPGAGVGVPGSGPYGEWTGAASPPSQAGANAGTSGIMTGSGSGLDSMFSRLSYSAAASRGGVPSGAPPGLSRTHGWMIGLVWRWLQDFLFLATAFRPNSLSSGLSTLISPLVAIRSSTHKDYHPKSKVINSTSVYLLTFHFLTLPFLLFSDLADYKIAIPQCDPRQFPGWAMSTYIYISIACLVSICRIYHVQMKVPFHSLSSLLHFII